MSWTASTHRKLAGDGRLAVRDGNEGFVEVGVDLVLGPVGVVSKRRSGDPQIIGGGCAKPGSSPKQTRGEPEPEALTHLASMASMRRSSASRSLRLCARSPAMRCRTRSEKALNF